MTVRPRRSAGCKRPRPSRIIAPSSIYRPIRFLLTPNEADFFRALRMVVADHYSISCKVRLADIITCTERDWRRGFANRIAQKHVDFVVTRMESSRIVAAIELDDRSHQRPERRLRDAFLNSLFRQMQIRLIRVPASWTYETAEVTEILAQNGLELSTKNSSFGTQKLRGK